jgi:hypothetical protein
MTEQQWVSYLRLLASQDTPVPICCVGCWYEQHPEGLAFPGDRVSSTLCHTHLAALPSEVKPPDTLLPRRCA